MELLDVVDEEDEVLYSQERALVHEKGLRHRSVMFFVQTKDGSLLVTKRSQDKKFFPGYWSVVLGGHVTSGDTYEETLEKEAREEIGTFGDYRYLGSFLKDIPEEKENVHLYSLTVDPDKVILSDKEFEKGIFLKFNEIEKRRHQHRFLPETDKVLEILNSSKLY